MAEFISLLVGILTYFVLFKLMFEDSADFITKLKRTACYLPFWVIFDYYPREVSGRILFWFPSGILAALMVYKLLTLLTVGPRISP